MMSCFPGLLTFVNCYNVKWATFVQNYFTLAKVIALLIIIIAGLYWLIAGNTENFSDPWTGTSTSPTYVAKSFYSGLFSYAGWNYLNFVVEELKSPYKNLPRAIVISLPMVTLIYVFANVAYFAVLTQAEILGSDAVAVDFGLKILGWASWIMPLSVALSAFGGLNGGIFASSRLFFVGARRGHLPTALTMVNTQVHTPMPSLLLLGVISLAYLTTTQVYQLIDYTAFIESLFCTFSVAALLWLRYKRPDLERPIKVSLQDGEKFARQNSNSSLSFAGQHRTSGLLPARLSLPRPAADLHLALRDRNGCPDHPLRDSRLHGDHLLGV